MRPIFAYAIDVETTGPLMTRHHLLSVGCCCLRIDPHSMTFAVVSRLQVNIENPVLVWDEKTEAFWQRNMPALAAICQDRVSPRRAAYLLANNMRQMQQMAAREGAIYRVVTDNAFFDVEWVHSLLALEPDSIPIRYNPSAKLLFMPTRDVIDVAQRLEALRDMKVPFRMDDFHPTVEHTHIPSQDAQVIAEKYMFYMQIINGHHA